jgi:hypothetical protein
MRIKEGHHHGPFVVKYSYCTFPARAVQYGNSLYLYWEKRENRILLTALAKGGGSSIKS